MSDKKNRPSYLLTPRRASTSSRFGASTSSTPAGSLSGSLLLSKSNGPGTPLFSSQLGQLESIGPGRAGTPSSYPLPRPRFGASFSGNSAGSRSGSPLLHKTVSSRQLESQRRVEGLLQEIQLYNSNLVDVLKSSLKGDSRKTNEEGADEGRNPSSPPPLHSPNPNSLMSLKDFASILEHEGGTSGGSNPRQHIADSSPAKEQPTAPGGAPPQQPTLIPVPPGAKKPAGQVRTSGLDAFSFLRQLYSECRNLMNILNASSSTQNGVTIFMEPDVVPPTPPSASLGVSYSGEALVEVQKNHRESLVYALPPSGLKQTKQQRRASVQLRNASQDRRPTVQFQTPGGLTSVGSNQSSPSPCPSAPPGAETLDNLRKMSTQGSTVDEKLEMLFLATNRSEMGASICGETLTDLVIKEGHRAQNETDDAGFETINNYAILEELGRGNFGKVMLACDQEGNWVAIKTMDCGVKAPKHRFGGLQAENAGSDSNLASISSLAPPTLRGRKKSILQLPDSMVMREVAIMKKLRHKNIVQLKEVIHDEEEDQTHLVMDYIFNGAVAQVQRDGTCVSTVKIELDLAKSYIRQAATGLEYLHKQGIVHRDIKPENMLIGAEKDAYLCDFGVSAVLTGDKVVDMSAGTQTFFSPELVRGDYEEAAKYGKQSDIWALGVTFYAIVFGKVPFHALNMMTLATSILNDPVPYPDDLALDDPLREIFEGLLQKDPKLRWTLRQLRHHPAMSDGSTSPADKSTSPGLVQKMRSTTNQENDSSWYGDLLGQGEIEVTQEEVDAAIVNQRVCLHRPIAMAVSGAPSDLPPSK